MSWATLQINVVKEDGTREEDVKELAGEPTDGLDIVELGHLANGILDEEDEENDIASIEILLIGHKGNPPEDKE